MKINKNIENLKKYNLTKNEYKEYKQNILNNESFSISKKEKNEFKYDLIISSILFAIAIIYNIYLLLSNNYDVLFDFSGFINFFLAFAISLINIYLIINYHKTRKITFIILNLIVLIMIIDGFLSLYDFYYRFSTYETFYFIPGIKLTIELKYETNEFNSLFMIVYYEFYIMIIYFIYSLTKFIKRNKKLKENNIKIID